MSKQEASCYYRLLVFCINDQVTLEVSRYSTCIASQFVVFLCTFGHVFVIFFSGAIWMSRFEVLLILLLIFTISIFCTSCLTLMIYLICNLKYTWFQSDLQKLWSLLLRWESFWTLILDFLELVILKCLWSTIKIFLIWNLKCFWY